MPSWWLEHVGHTADYAVAVKNQNRSGSLEAVIGLARGVAVWGQRVGKRAGESVGILAHALMAEHVIGAKLLADRVPANDGTAVKAGAELLARNADLQSSVLGAVLKSFPYSEFRKLLGEHLDLTAAYISDLSKNDEPAFNQHVALARKNGIELDRFSDQHL